MTTLRTTATAVAFTAALAAGLTACGGDDKKAPSAKDAWSKAQDTAGTYKSLEVKATGKTDGKDSNMTVKGAVDDSKTQLDGTMGGPKVSIITLDKKSWIKADEAYWKQTMGSTNAAMASKAANIWLEVPESTSSSDSDTLSSLVKELRDDSKDTNKRLLSDKSTVSEDTVDGTQAWKITTEDEKTHAWVSQDDAHDVLKLDGAAEKGKENDAMNAMTFVSHDKDYGIKAPSSAKSVMDVFSK